MIEAVILVYDPQNLDKKDDILAFKAAVEPLLDKT